jgi:hypothetical protein
MATIISHQIESDNLNSQLNNKKYVKKMQKMPTN